MKKALCFCPGIGLGRASEELEERFIENGGLLLEKLIGTWNGRCTSIRNFSAKELEQATNNYDSANIFGKDYGCQWYKGSIKGRMVSVKKWDGIHDVKAINDIVVAAQMNAHNSILKLIGCCLETRFPSAVFDFPENGTLFQHIHISDETTTPPQPQPQPQPLLWKSRLRIATEIASAVAYLHTAFRSPIIHRDIKSSHVFLDGDNVAKLSSFELSIALPEGKTHVQDVVMGTFGYAAPEYIHTGSVSEKVDVYSLGVLLMELLTGQKPCVYDFDLIIASFRTHVLSNEENQVLDPTIQEEIGRIEVQQQVRTMSELALRCTVENPEERPTMLDVARQLLQLRRTAAVDH